MENVMKNGFAELSAYEMNEVDGGLIMTGPMLGPITVVLLARLIGKYM
jgi:hypothetical protein